MAPTTVPDFSPAALTRLRVAAGWKRPELARRAGISPHALAKYEYGQCRPSAEALARLANALAVTDRALCVQ